MKKKTAVKKKEILQLKTWCWDATKKTNQNMEDEINEFMREYKFDPDSFELFEMGEGMIFAKILYIK